MSDVRRTQQALAQSVKGGRALRTLVSSIALLSVAATSAGAQQLPALRFREAPLMSFSAASSYYSGIDTSYGLCTSGFSTAVCNLAQTPPALEITAKALGQGRGGQAIAPKEYLRNAFEYVHNFIEITPTYGLSKGGLGAMADRYGTAFDQAHLLVSLLRKYNSGSLGNTITAVYRHGQVSLSAAQVKSWLGTEDARDTCHLLANGGIPAVVQGQSDCANVTAATSYTTVMDHVWVQATVVTNGGSAEVFQIDPSFKDHTPHTGLDLENVMFTGTSASASSLRSTGLGAVTPTTLGSSPTQVSAIREVEPANMNTQLTSIRSALVSAIGGLDNPRIEDVVGGNGDIIATTIPNAMSTTDFMPYGAGNTSNVTSWETDIPDGYRTVVGITYGGTPLTLYADEIYAYGLHVSPNEGSDLRIYLGDVELATPAGVASDLTLSINHPYAAGSGAYMDRVSTASVVKDLTSAVGNDTTLNVILALGQVDKARPDWERTMVSREGLLNTKAARTERLGHWRMRAVVVTEWMALATQTDKLMAGVTKGTIQHHHSLGFIGANVRYHHMDVDSGLSAVRADRDMEGERGIRLTLAGLRARLEGYVLRSAASAASTNSTPELFAGIMGAVNYNKVGANEPYFLDVTDADAFTAATAVTEQYATGAQSTIEDYIEQYVTDGYRVLMPQIGQIYSSAYAPVFEQDLDDPNHPFFRRYAALAFKADASDIANLVTSDESGTQFLKGGAAQQQGPGKGIPDLEMFIPELRNSTAPMVQVGVNVDPSTGEPTLQNTDMVTGTGPFPYSLPFIRTYSPDDRANPFNVTGGKWKNYYDKRFSQTTDPYPALGYGRNTPAVVAAGAVMGIFVSTKLLEEHIDLGALVLAQTLISNTPLAATVQIAETFDAPIRFYSVGDTERVTERGTVATLSSKFNFGGKMVYFRMTQPSGVEHYYASNVDEGELNSPNVTTCLIPGVGWAEAPNRNSLVFVRWPEGVHLRIDRGLDCARPVESVVNSLGRQLTFDATGKVTESVTSGTAREVTVTPTQVTLPDGQTITYAFASGPSAAHRMVSVKLPASAGSDLDAQIEYDAFKRVAKMIDAEGRPTEHHYAGLGPSARTEIRTGLQASSGLYANASTALNIATATSFDRLGQRVRSVDGVGASTINSYDGFGRLARTTRPLGQYTTYEYDERNNLLFERSYAASGGTPLEKAWTYEKSCALTASGFSTASILSCDRPVTVEDARNNVATVGYTTTTGSYTYPNGLSDVTVSWSGTGRIATRREPCPSTGTCGSGDVNAPTTTYAYNTNGQIVESVGPATVENPSGMKTTWAYTAGDLTSVVVDADGLALQTSYSYTPSGTSLIIESEDARGIATTFEFDAMRRLRKITEPTGDYALSSYNANGWPTSVERFADGTTTNPLQKTAKTYFKSGLVYRTYGPQCFDNNGDPDYTNAECDITENSYDSAARLATVTDPVSRVTKRVYDKAGRTLEMHSAVGTALAQITASYEYSANGQRSKAMDANGNVVTYHYDAYDRLAIMAYPEDKVCGPSTPCARATPNNPVTVDGSEPYYTSLPEYADYERIVYDANGNMESKRTRGGDFILRSFDALNREFARETRLNSTGGTLERRVETEYDAASKVKTVVDTVSGIEVAYGYDTAGRRKSEATDDGIATREVAYKLDSAGNTISIQWPEATVFTAHYAYGDLNNVTEICQGTDIDDVCTAPTRYAEYQYDHLGRRDFATLANGRTADYTYEKDSTLKDLLYADLIDVDGSGSAPLEDGHWEFKYTKANQLEWKKQPMAFTWQPSATQLGAIHYIANGLNQYHTQNAAPITYDDQGNLTSQGNWSYFYDAENRLVRACNSTTHTPATCSGATKDTAYVYDPLDRRIRKTVKDEYVSNYLWAGQNIIAEYDGTGDLLRRYVHGPGVDEPIVEERYGSGAGTYYYHADQLGSIVARTNSSGVVDDPNDYYSYSSQGEPVDTAMQGSIWRFAGRQLDEETGLYYNRARMYHPGLGRFLQTDPAGDTDSLNLYQYALWDPITNKDPSGKCVGPALAVCAGAAVGAISGGVGGYIASGGKLNATLAGAVAGGVVGAALHPEGSFAAGGMAAVASVGGQVVGQVASNISDGAPLAANITVDPMATAGAAIGTTFAGPAGSAAGAVVEGVASGIGETIGDYTGGIVSKATPTDIQITDKAGNLNIQLVPSIPAQAQQPLPPPPPKMCPDAQCP